MNGEVDNLSIASQIQFLIQDESQAISGYLNFLQCNALILPAEMIGKINEIIADEKEHLEALSSMATQFDGVQASED